MATAAPATETPAPAATPAPAPPSAPSTGGDSSPEQILDNLRSNTIRWGHEGNKTDAPSEPNSETPPAQTAEGSTPPTDTPAPVAPSSAHQDWIKRYGDPEKAATEAFALEQRAAAMAKELKELKSAQPAPAPQAPAQPVATAPAPVAPPAAPAVQAQPVQPEAPALSIEDQAIDHALTNDAQCRALIGQYNKNNDALKVLFDPQTGAGVIPTLQEEIRKAQTLIDHPSVDELVKDEARLALRNAQADLATRRAEAAELRLTNKELNLDFRSRIDGYVGQLNGQSAERAREADFEKEAETKAQEFVGQWPAAFDAAFKEMGFDAEMRAEIHDAVKTQALARPGRIDLKDLPTFMKEALKVEHDKVDKYHRNQARIYALKKNADVAPAPANPVATAPPPTEADDPLERMRLMTRQAFRAKGAR